MTDEGRIANETAGGEGALTLEHGIPNTDEHDGSRRVVLWLGAMAPRRLVAGCGLHDLRVISATRWSVGTLTPRARALVLEAPISDSEFAIWGAQVSAEALDHGIAVALVHYHRESRLPLMEPNELLQYFEAVKALQHAGLPDVRALYGDWGAVANWARDHDPGLGANRQLVLTGNVPEDGASELLLRRAFHDLTSISLELLVGGKSGAGVWLVRPGQSDLFRRAMPFVVKIHTREKMDRERSNWLIVRDGVPSRLHAPLDPDRCVRGHALGLVVYAVVDRAVPFRSALSMAPEALVASVFKHTLSGFHASARTANCSAAAEFGDGRLKALRWSDDLRQAAALARVRGSS